MDSKRPIDVGISSSLIDLKAELLRKQGEVQSSKSRQQGVQKSLKKSDLLKAKSVYASKNKGIDTRSAKDLEISAEEAAKHASSRSILEEKAKLYEKMTSEALEHDEHEHPVLAQSLVNFTQKAIDQLRESRDVGHLKRSLESGEESVVKDWDYDVNEDEWTEFTDALGRTRRCLKSDLPSFINRDEELARPQNPGICLSREAGERLLEMKRDKWEQEAEEAAVKEKVHYQDVLYDEVRAHGTGYYGFSKDVSERDEQLKELKKLSSETAATREKVLKERGHKKSQLKERLRKIRAKKRAKLGLPPEPHDPNDHDDEDDDEGLPQDEEITGEGPPGILDLDPTTSIRPTVPDIRPWDFGKAGVFGPRPTTFDELDEKWLRDRRSDRNADFAPPTNLYSEGGLKRAYARKASATATSTSTSADSQAHSSSKYANFVQASEPMTLGEETAEPLIGPVPLKPFMPPDQFWKGRGSSSSKPSSQKPIRIVDELPAPVDEGSDEFARGRGREVAPPQTFDYFHGQPNRPPARSRGRSDEVVADAVSSGLKALRERFDAEQRAKGNKGEEGDKKEFKGFI